MLQCCIWLQANIQSALSLKPLWTASRTSSSNTTGKGHQGNGLFLQVHGNLSSETQSSLAAWDCLIIRELATFPVRGWLCLEQQKAALRTTMLPKFGRYRSAVWSGRKFPALVGTKWNLDFRAAVSPGERLPCKQCFKFPIMTRGAKISPHWVHFSRSMRWKGCLEVSGLISCWSWTPCTAKGQVLWTFSNQNLNVCQHGNSRVFLGDLFQSSPTHTGNILMCNQWDPALLHALSAGSEESQPLGHTLELLILFPSCWDTLPAWVYTAQPSFNNF